MRSKSNLFSVVHHIAIICSDYKKSKKFYIETLGFTPIKEIYRKEKDSYKLDLAINGSYQIELFSFPNAPARLSYPEAAGLRHIALGVDSVEMTVKDLLAKGVTVEPIRIDSTTVVAKKKYTFFSDPDGLPIEIYEL